MGNMEREKGKENPPGELGLLFLTKLGLGNTRSLIGNLISPEGHSVLLAKEWVCISVYMELTDPDRGQSTSALACRLLSFTRWC